MLALFQRAMMGKPAVVAGVKLPPLTLAHAYCLHAWESPLVCGGAVDLAAFGVALWTCAQPCWPFDRFSRDVVRGVPERALARLGKRYDVRNFGRDVDALREHIAYHATTPPRFRKTEQERGRGLCAPWPLVVAVQIIPLLGERKTWTSPLPYVMAHKIALDNTAGDTSWKSEEEEAQGYANGSHP